MTNTHGLGDCLGTPGKHSCRSLLARYVRHVANPHSVIGNFHALHINSDLDLPPWIPPTETKDTELEWAPLHTLDLSRITGDGYTDVPEDVVRDVGEAFNKVGFIYCENHGLSYGELLRQ